MRNRLTGAVLAALLTASSMLAQQSQFQGSVARGSNT